LRVPDVALLDIERPGRGGLGVLSLPRAALRRSGRQDPHREQDRSRPPGTAQWMAVTPFDAVLCDLDGVLRHFDHERQADIEARYGLPLMKIAFAPELIGPATLGHISETQWAAQVAEALGGGESARAAVAEFTRVPFWVDEEVRALLAKAQERVPVVLVTNAMDTLEEHLDRLGLTHFADDVVSSARVGVAKPDRRIYEIAAERAEVPPERCLFVDDRLPNVEGAEAVGMTGVHYRSVADLAGALGLEQLL
jgi:putative hydrolase of the HAD superfamily